MVRADTEYRPGNRSSVGLYGCEMTKAQRFDYARLNRCRRVVQSVGAKAVAHHGAGRSGALARGNQIGDRFSDIVRVWRTCCREQSVEVLEHGTRDLSDGTVFRRPRRVG